MQSCDVLQHLKFAQNLLHSSASLLMANTYRAESNVGIAKNGLWYQTDLEKPPFDFSKPVLCVPTHLILEPDLGCLFKLR